MVQVFINVKTTGLNYTRASIWNISGMITDGRREEYFDYSMRPYKKDIMPEALRVSGVTEAQLMNFEDQNVVFTDFVNLLNRYISLGDYDSKAQLIGYNSNFEANFLREWFKFNNFDKFGYYFWFPYIDIMTFAGVVLMNKREQLPNFKLPTVYYFATGKVMKTRGGKAEIQCMRELYNALADMGANRIPDIKIPVRQVRSN